MSDTIRLFMWGYQRSFRITLKVAAQTLFETIGAPGEPEALLIGVRRPGIADAHPVCIETEDDAWPLSLFDGLDGDVAAAIATHPLKNMYYGDAKSMQDKPEKIRRSAIQQVVQSRLTQYDAENDALSYCGDPTPIDKHYVVPVIQAPASLIRLYPPIERLSYEDRPRRLSFVDACVRQLLKDASIALYRPDAGAHLDEFRDGGEVAVRGARRFMQEMVGMVRRDGVPGDLFAVINALAQLNYEGSPNDGSLAFADPQRDSLSFVTELAEPVSMRELRWCRKLLQMATDDTPLISDCNAALGVGRVKHADGSDGAFRVVFGDQSSWELYAGARELLRVRSGRPHLPGEPVEKARFVENATRVFAGSPCNPERLWEIWSAFISKSGGAMVIVAADAEAEAKRLSAQGMRIEQRPTTEELLDRARRIDGATLLDPLGNCHAIGMILDGNANDACTPSRGSRYNSAVRYMHSGEAPRMALILSDDHTVDIEPMLRPRVSLAAIEEAIELLSVATINNYLEPRNFLDAHRFYLNAEQCDRANKALAHVRSMPKDGGRFIILTTPFFAQSCDER